MNSIWFLMFFVTCKCCFTVHSLLKATLRWLPNILHFKYIYVFITVKKTTVMRLVPFEKTFTGERRPLVAGYTLHTVNSMDSLWRRDWMWHMENRAVMWPSIRVLHTDDNGRLTLGSMAALDNHGALLMRQTMNW